MGESDQIKQGTADFWRASLALFAGALVTFAALYATQPLLPLFTREFNVSPAVASLSLSVSSGALAIFLPLVSTLSEAWGRKQVMAVALLGVAVLMLLVGASSNFGMLLVIRALQGVVLAAIPATAMAYLGEEMQPASLGFAVGLYISGNTIGGMSGRIVGSILTDAVSWRFALTTMGVLSLVAAVGFWLLLPPSRHFVHRRPSLGLLYGGMGRHLRDPGMVHLFVIAFLLMGCFVSIYNYVGFQLVEPPYSLSQTAVGWIFTLYLVGTFSSTFMGRLADRIGRRRVLWVGVTIMVAGALITLAENLPLKLLGIAVFTFGFFTGHSVASSWVARRAQTDRSQASALYLFAYYMGGSVIGAVSGVAWTSFHWVGVVGLITALLGLALLLAARLTRIPPLVPLPSAP